ncbi:MAG: endonuclease/exonuclease/phosphatase family protein [Clostridia bacterium]|nr:endonuclease/exonuclease/phosphatase family protein [Clostridia bacterium]
MSNSILRAPEAEWRIMSSNILFDKTLADRLPLIADYYRACGADIIGMQEVNKIGTSLFETLSDLYTPVATRHPEDKHCFTPILYRHDRFDAVESGSELYRMRGTDTKSMAWVILADRESGQKLALINSHGSLILKSYNLEATDAVEGEQWRVDNVRQMLEKKDELRAKYGASLPVFITGDFNSRQPRDSIMNMKKVLPDSATVAKLGATEGIDSFHRVPGRPCDEGNPIDFIFVTEDTVEVLTHNIPHDETALAISDHCPVYIDAKRK